MKFNFLIIGAGAVGTYLGANLARQGHQITFLERAGARPDFASQGLQLIQEGEIHQIPAPGLITNPELIPQLEFDLILLALKTYHLPDLLPALVELGPQLPPLLCLTNGVESESRLAAALGEEKIIPSTVTSAIDRIAQGQVSVRKHRGTGLAGNHPLLPDLLAAFQEADLKPAIFENPADMKWSKLILNLLGNASCAILNIGPGEIYTNPELYDLERRQILECLAVMRGLGIRIVDLPGVPVRLLCGVISWLPPLLARPILARSIGGGRGQKMPSFHIDLHSGKGLSEVDQLNGAVARHGEKLGIPSPVNTLLCNTLIDLTKGRISLADFDQKPAVLLDKLTE